MSTEFKGFDSSINDELGFPVLGLGSKLITAGAIPAAHEVSLVREVLSRREAELHARMYDCLKGSDLDILAERLGIEMDPLGKNISRLLQTIEERLVAGLDPRRVLIELIRDADEAAAREAQQWVDDLETL